MQLHERFIEKSSTVPVIAKYTFASVDVFREHENSTQ
jgi:hypothetical protein